VDCPVGVVLAVREYESWFLASIPSLRTHPDILDEAPAHEAPETVRDAKGELSWRLSVPRYSEMRHQPAFSQQMDLGQASACRSFARCGRRWSVPPMNSPGVRVWLDLAYDGSGFSGWAAQRNLRTVQGVLQDALGVLARSAPPRLTVAGRTDAGVHARGQVAHVDLAPDVAGDPLLLRRLNGLLPQDVRVRAARAAPDGFDARFSAVWRRYRYRVTDGAGAADPLRRHDTLAWPRPLALDRLQEAGAGLVGEHDFAAFCRRREGATTRRAVLSLSWSREDVLVMDVTADAFCHSMVRSLVGAQLAVGEGRRPPDWPVGLLARTERADGVPVAPPHGLCLEQVGYPPDDQLLDRQSVTRALRLPPAPVVAAVADGP